VGITIIQKDSDHEKGKVPPFWTKDNPGKLPVMEQVQKGSKLVWNSDKRDVYLFQAYDKWTTLFGVPVTAAPNSVEDAAEQIANVMDDATDFAKETESKTTGKAEQDPNDVDDLPF
jgi:hypothetical protein